MYSVKLRKLFNSSSKFFREKAPGMLAPVPTEHDVIKLKTECEITILNRLLEFANRSTRLNTEFQLVTDLQREWDSALEPAFGTQRSADVGTRATARNDQHVNTRGLSGSRVSQEKWLEREVSNTTET